MSRAYRELWNPQQFTLFLQFQAVMGTDSEHRHGKKPATSVLWSLPQPFFVKQLCLIKDSVTVAVSPGCAEFWMCALCLQCLGTKLHISVYVIKHRIPLSFGCHLSSSYFSPLYFSVLGIEPSTQNLGKCCCVKLYLWPSFSLSF